MPPERPPQRSRQALVTTGQSVEVVLEAARVPARWIPQVAAALTMTYVSLPFLQVRRETGPGLVYTRHAGTTMPALYVVPPSRVQRRRESGLCLFTVIALLAGLVA
jgi:hypothetical protein